MKTSTTINNIEPKGSFNKIVFRLKKFTNIKFCISTRLYTKFKVLNNLINHEDWTEKKYISKKEKFNTIINKHHWIDTLNEIDINEIDFDEFQIKFGDLIQDLEIKFNKDLRQGDILRVNLKIILYSTILLPNPDYREVDKIIKEFFYLKANISKYEKEKPVSAISKGDIALINTIKNNLGKNNIDSFGQNQNPVFLIELKQIKQKFRKEYLGSEFRRGSGLNEEELGKLERDYGINSKSTYERNCSDYRRLPIDDMIFNFSKEDFESAILFLYTKTQKENKSFSISTLELLLQKYKQRFA